MNKYFPIAFILSSLLVLNTPYCANAEEVVSKPRVTENLSEALKGDYIGKDGRLKKSVADVIYKNLDKISDEYIRAFLKKIEDTKNKLEEVKIDSSFQKIFSKSLEKKEVFEDTIAKLDDIAVNLNNILSYKKNIIKVILNLAPNAKHEKLSENIKSTTFSDYVKNLQKKMLADIIDPKASESLVRLNIEKKISAKLFKRIVRKESKKKIDKKTSNALLANYKKLRNNMPVLISHIRSVISDISGLSMRFVPYLEEKSYKEDLKNALNKGNNMPYTEDVHNETIHPIITIEDTDKDRLAKIFLNVKHPRELFKYIKEVLKLFKTLENQVVVAELKNMNSIYTKWYESDKRVPIDRASYVVTLVDLYNLFVIETGMGEQLKQFSNNQKKKLKSLAQEDDISKALNARKNFKKLSKNISKKSFLKSVKSNKNID